MIEYIEKKHWTDPDIFIGRTYAPIFMVKDSVEYFVSNRVVNGSYHEEQELKGIKSMLLMTEGKYFKFYGFFDDPFEMLTMIEERGLTFESPKKLFCDCHGIPKYGAGFTDFSGNCREIALAFSYRIYDSDLLATLQTEVQKLISHN